MGKTNRKKKRTHLKKDEEGPHTFVINKGPVRKIGIQLMLDIRKVLEPYTASNVKARKRNKLKDYIHVSGQFGVTHLLVLSRSMLGYINIRICKVPRGPTLTFRVNNYMLAKDVISLLRRPKSTKTGHDSAPLLIMNGFDDKLAHHQLITTSLQNMLPSINVKTIQLSSVKRCLLVDYHPETDMIELRHYSVAAVPVGVNKAVKKLMKKIPDLSKYSDISEFLTNGYFSESDGEDQPDNQVELPQAIAGRGNMKSNRSAIRLTELGPRLTLKLVKIEEGIGEGEVLYHSYVQKTAEEKNELRKKIKKNKALKEKRKKEQEKNVKEKKKMEAGKRKKESRNKTNQKRTEDESCSEDDDVEYYKEEVGAAPDPELLLKTKQTKRSAGFTRTPDAKKVKFCPSTTLPPTDPQAPIEKKKSKPKVRGLAIRKRM